MDKESDKWMDHDSNMDKESIRWMDQESNIPSNSKPLGKKINLIISNTASKSFKKDPSFNKNQGNEKRIKIILRRNDSTKGNGTKHFVEKDTNQIYYVTQIVKNPLSSVFKTLYDLNSSNSEVRWKSTALNRLKEIGPRKSQSFDSFPQEENKDIFPEESHSFCSLESTESFSLYYSKTADLASPIFDVRRFIYPDRIHYSYQNMKEKAFDVKIKQSSNGLPLIVRESLTFSPYSVEKVPEVPISNLKITKTPMDLSFAFSDSDNGGWLDSNEKELTSESFDEDEAFKKYVPVPDDKAKKNI